MKFCRLRLRLALQVKVLAAYLALSFVMSASANDCQKNSFDDFLFNLPSPIRHPPFNNYSVNKFPYEGVTIITDIFVSRDDGLDYAILDPVRLI